MLILFISNHFYALQSTVSIHTSLIPTLRPDSRRASVHSSSFHDLAVASFSMSTALILSLFLPQVLCRKESFTFSCNLPKLVSLHFIFSLPRCKFHSLATYFPLCVVYAFSLLSTLQQTSLSFLKSTRRKQLHSYNSSRLPQQIGYIMSSPAAQIYE